MSPAFIDGYRCDRELLESGKLYLRLSSGREDLSAPPDMPQDDDPVFGPLTWFKYYDSKSCGMEFQDGNCYLLIDQSLGLHVCNGMLWYHNLYFCPTFFIAG